MVAPSLYRALYLACTYRNRRSGLTHCHTAINQFAAGWIGTSLARHAVLVPGGAAATDRADELATLDEREAAVGSDQHRIESGDIGARRILHDREESAGGPPVTCRRAGLALRDADRCHLRLVHLVEIDEIAIGIDDRDREFPIAWRLLCLLHRGGDDFSRHDRR
jgi:hypothetical protein